MTSLTVSKPEAKPSDASRPADKRASSRKNREADEETLRFITTLIFAEALYNATDPWDPERAA